VNEEIDSSLIHFEVLLDDSLFKKNPRFIVYGDHRPSWRLGEKFLKSENWKTKKWLFFPVYIPVLAFNGIWGSFNYLRRVPDFGHRERQKVLSQIVSIVESQEINFVVHTGDIVENGNYPSQWEDFLIETAYEFPLLRKVPYYPVPGNHDQSNDKKFGSYNYDFVFPDSRFYTKRFPNVDLIFLDSSILLDQDNNIEPSERELLFRKYFYSGESEITESWLERQLFKARNKNKIIIMHHPIFSFGFHSGNWDSRGENAQEYLFREKLISIFKREGVDLILSGHEHYYEHNILDYNYEGLNNKMHIIVTGGGGTRLRDVPTDDAVKRKKIQFSRQGYTVDSISRSKSYHFVVVEVDSSEIIIYVKKVLTGQESGTIVIDEIAF